MGVVDEVGAEEGIGGVGPEMPDACDVRPVRPGVVDDGDAALGDLFAEGESQT